MGGADVDGDGGSAKLRRYEGAKRAWERDKKAAKRLIDLSVKAGAKRCQFDRDATVAWVILGFASPK